MAADCRLGEPKSVWERNLGDGAGAILIGNSSVMTETGPLYSLYDEILDTWRSEDDRFILSSEGRFIAEEGYLRLTRESISERTKKYSLKKEEFDSLVLAIPDKRRQIELANNLGFDVKKVQDSLLDQIGDTGCAYSIMLLIAALEEAKTGDKILWTSYGNGSDAFMLTMTAERDKTVKRRCLKDYIQSKQLLPDYATYLRWRKIIPESKPAYPLGEIAVAALHREQAQNYRLYGGKCTACGTLQYPPQRICVKCQAKDQVEFVRLSDKKVELVTFSLDYGSWSPQDAFHRKRRQF